MNQVDYFLKKKGLSESRDKYFSKLDELDTVMKKYNVSPEEVYKGEAPEEVMQLAVETERLRVIAEGTIKYNINQFKKNPADVEAFQKEYEQSSLVAQKTEEDIKAYEEAEKRYKANPTPQNFKRMTDAKGISPEFSINGGKLSDKEQMENTHEQMRQIYQQKAAERDREEMAMYEEMAKSKDPQAQKIAQMKIAEKIRLKENAEDLAQSEAEAKKLFAERG